MFVFFLIRLHDLVVNSLPLPSLAPLLPREIRSNLTNPNTCDFLRPDGDVNEAHPNHVNQFVLGLYLSFRPSLTTEYMYSGNVIKLFRVINVLVISELESMLFEMGAHKHKAATRPVQ